MAAATPAPRLPPELLHHLCQQTTEPSTLRALTLTSRTLHTFATPRLYRDFATVDIRTLVLFLRTLSGASGPRLAAHLRSFRYEDRYEVKLWTAEQAVVDKGGAAGGGSVRGASGQKAKLLERWGDGALTAGERDWWSRLGALATWVWGWVWVLSGLALWTGKPTSALAATAATAAPAVTLPSGLRSAERIVGTYTPVADPAVCRTPLFEDVFLVVRRLVNPQKMSGCERFALVLRMDYWPIGLKVLAEIEEWIEVWREALRGGDIDGGVDGWGPPWIVALEREEAAV